jgi:hypothetical protein
MSSSQSEALISGGSFNPGSNVNDELYGQIGGA